MGYCYCPNKMERLYYLDGTSEPILEWRHDCVHAVLSTIIHAPSGTYRMDVVEIVERFDELACCSVDFYKAQLVNGVLSFVEYMDIAKVE